MLVFALICEITLTPLLPQVAPLLKYCLNTGEGFQHVHDDMTFKLLFLAC